MSNVEKLVNIIHVCLNIDNEFQKGILSNVSTADLGIVPEELIGCFNHIFYSNARETSKILGKCEERVGLSCHIGEK